MEHNEYEHYSQDLTRLLNEWASGDEEAGNRVVSLVYDVLKQHARTHMKREYKNVGRTTDLLNRAFGKVMVRDNQAVWKNRTHFYNAMGKAFRQILIDDARKRTAQMRGGDQDDLELDDEPGAVDRLSPHMLLALDQALTALEDHDPLLAQVVICRFYVGLTIEETAEALDIPEIKVQRSWKFAQSWLTKRLKG